MASGESNDEVEYHEGGGIQYSNRPFHQRRRHRNMVNQAFKILANSQSYMDTLTLFIVQEVLHTIRRCTNWKVSRIRRTVRHIRVFMSNFSYA